MLKYIHINVLAPSVVPRSNCADLFNLTNHPSKSYFVNPLHRITLCLLRNANDIKPNSLSAFTGCLLLIWFVCVVCCCVVCYSSVSLTFSDGEINLTVTSFQCCKNFNWSIKAYTGVYTLWEILCKWTDRHIRSRRKTRSVQRYSQYVTFCNMTVTRCSCYRR